MSKRTGGVFAAFRGCFRESPPYPSSFPLWCKIEWWYSPRLQMKISLEASKMHLDNCFLWWWERGQTKLASNERIFSPLKPKECCVVAWAWAECKGLWVLVLTLAGVGTLAIFLDLAVPLFLILKGNVMGEPDQSILAMLQGATENLGKCLGEQNGAIVACWREDLPPSTPALISSFLLLFIFSIEIYLNQACSCGWKTVACHVSKQRTLWLSSLQPLRLHNCAPWRD